MRAYTRVRALEKDHLRSKLRELYMQDCIFDKFKCSISHDDQFFMTGTYNGLARPPACLPACRHTIFMPRANQSRGVQLSLAVAVVVTNEFSGWPRGREKDMGGLTTHS